MTQSRHRTLTPWIDELPDYIYAALERVGLSRRPYQKVACLESLRLLRNGANVEINLPPGTGKTLISQIIGCIWCRESSHDRTVLCVVPTSALREQHYRYCVWWAQDLCKPLEITSEWIHRKSKFHNQVADHSNFWFTLPEVLYNAITKTAHISYEVFDKVGLVIFDEYDAFSIGVLRAEGYKLRFTKDSDRLISLLKQRERRYLLMSATPAQDRIDEET